MDEMKQHCFQLFEALEMQYSNKIIDLDVKGKQDFIKILNLITLETALKKKDGACQKLIDEKIFYSEDVVIPVTYIKSNDDATGLFARYFNKFEELKEFYCSTIIDNFLMVLIEMAQNIPYHCMGSFGYIGVTFRGNDNNEGPYLSLSIADFGVGIRRSLSELEYKYRHFWNDSFAITLALKEKVSRLKVDGRGKGLAGVYSSVKKHEGTLWLRSGRGLFIHKKEDYEAIELENWYPGVQCNVRMPLT